MAPIPRGIKYRRKRFAGEGDGYGRYKLGEEILMRRARKDYNDILAKVKPKFFRRLYNWLFKRKLKPTKSTKGWRCGTTAFIYDPSWMIRVEQYEPPENTGQVLKR